MEYLKKIRIYIGSAVKVRKLKEPVLKVSKRVKIENRTAILVA